MITSKFVPRTPDENSSEHVVGLGFAVFAVFLVGMWAHAGVRWLLIHSRWRMMTARCQA